MNTAQTSLYFFEWGQARKHFLARGIDPKQADAKRHALHVKALGRDKSSKKFTNADLDKVIAAFRAVYDGGNLDLQMQQLDQPERRQSAAQARIRVLMLHLGLEPGRESGYVDGMSRRIFGVERYHTLDAVRLAQLEGVLVRRLHQLHDAERVEEIRGAAAEHAVNIGKVLDKAGGAEGSEEIPAQTGERDEPF